MELTPRLLSLALAFVVATPYGVSAQSTAHPNGPSQSSPAAPSGHASADPPTGSAQAPAMPHASTPGATAPSAPPGTAPGTPAASGGTPPGPALQPQGYTYDPDGRRDPFISLLRRGNDVEKPTAGSRAGGLAGLETGEVTLKGTVASRGAFVGIVLGVDSKTYIVKAGDRLLDGTIRTITQDSLVITQQVTDPLSLEKQREVRKVLRQTEEAK